MRLTFTPGRSDHQLVINDRTDNGPPIIHPTDTFEVTDSRGRHLLARYHPLIQPAQ